MNAWLALLRPGDWGVIMLGMVGVVGSFLFLWSSGKPERAVVRVDGRVVAEFPLTAPRRFPVQGALGETVIEIAPGRARIQSDPGSRQYCVQQGWLTRPNAIALCAPSHVSLTLTGAITLHDSINY